MPAREKKRETLAGLFVLVGLLLLGVLIVQFGRFGDRFKGHYPLYIEFAETAGIIKGSEVRLRGAKIGHVSTAPELVTGPGSSHVRMEIRIRNGVNIPREAAIQIASAGFLGDKFIDILPPEKESGDYFEPGETIMGAGAGGFDALKSDAESIARDAAKLLKDARESFVKLDEALSEVKTVGASLNVTMTKVNTRFLSEKNLDNIESAIANFESASREINKTTRKLDPAIEDARKTFASLQKAAESADALIADARQEIRHVSPALKEVPGAVRSIARAAEKAEETMDALQNKDGLVGTLAHDRETGHNARELIRNLKRYGILRYRDDSTKEERDPRNKFSGSRR